MPTHMRRCIRPREREYRGQLADQTGQPNIRPSPRVRKGLENFSAACSVGFNPQGDQHHEESKDMNEQQETLQTGEPMSVPPIEDGGYHRNCNRQERPMPSLKRIYMVYGRDRVYGDQQTLNQGTGEKAYTGERCLPAQDCEPS